MGNNNNHILYLILLVGTLLGLSACTDEKKKFERPSELVLMHEEPVYNEVTQTFSLTLLSDSTEGAKLTYYLLDGDSILMQNETGVFNGIAPLDEGYNIRLQAEWTDTTLFAFDHIFGFILPREPVEPMSKDELQHLINAKDKSIKVCDNEHLSQGVSVKTIESQYPVTTLLETIERIEQGIWTSVEVKEVSYDENNLITDITLKPKEVIPDPEEEEEYY